MYMDAYFYRCMPTYIYKVKMYGGLKNSFYFYSIAILVFNSTRQVFVFVKQFRPGTMRTKYLHNYVFMHVYLSKRVQ